MGREFPEVKKERIRQQKGKKVKLSKSKLYQTETKTPVQEYDSQRKASREKALSLYWSYSQEKSTCHKKGGKRRMVSSTVIFERPPTMKLSLGICWVFKEWQGMFFSLHNRPWNLVHGSVYVYRKYRNTN